MNYLQMILVTLFVISGATLARAQPDDPYDAEMKRWTKQEKEHIGRLLQIRFDVRRSGGTFVGIQEELLHKYPNFWLKTLEQYEHDQSARVRYTAYAYAWRIGIAHRPVDPIRKIVVKQLVEACFDPEGVVWQSAARWLLEFDAQDFSSETRAYLGDHAIKEPVRDDVLLVVGVAEVNVVDKWMMRMAPKHLNAVLALARMGHDEYALQAVERFKKLERDRNSRGRAYLGRSQLIHLTYTRHPILLAYVDEYLNLDDDEGKVTLREGGDYAVRSYACAALEALRVNYPDFPVKESDTFHCSSDDLAKTREWVKARLGAGE